CPAPGRLLAIISPGGSAVLGEEPITAFKAEYAQADVSVALVLDHKTDRRELNLPPLLDLYQPGQLIKGMIVGDNRTGAERYDEALALLIPAMVSASWMDYERQTAFNTFADVFRKY